MSEQYFVTLEKIIERHNLEIVYCPKPANEIQIITNEVNRPGIVMTGYTDYFDPLRLQILGWTEFGCLLNMTDVIIQLEEWDATKAYDRLGLDNEYAKILDVKVPVITVPITPGRNLAVIVETAAMNNRQKKMGYNGAKELMHSLGMEDIEPNDKELEIWNNS